MHGQPLSSALEKFSIESVVVTFYGGISKMIHHNLSALHLTNIAPFPSPCTLLTYQLPTFEVSYIHVIVSGEEEPGNKANPGLTSFFTVSSQPLQAMQ